MHGHIWHECLHVAQYYAPRGRPRLLMLGESIGQRYLAGSDQLIGILGEAGTGKSSLLRGMFPGLELTNDDTGVNLRPLPLMRMFQDGAFTAQTFHLDARFEAAFTPLPELAEAIRAALRDGRRVVVEHFETIHPLLGMNAQCLIGIGEEVIVTRPNVFGPYPADVCAAIEGTAVFRRMAHSAEDLTSLALELDTGRQQPQAHSDVPRGFLIGFDERPAALDLERVEARVREWIAQGVPIQYADPNHIRIGDRLYPCTGPRLHVANASEIRNYRLRHDLVYDGMSGRYWLAGFIAEPRLTSYVDRHPEPLAGGAPPQPGGEER